MLASPFSLPNKRVLCTNTLTHACHGKAHGRLITAPQLWHGQSQTLPFPTPTLLAPLLNVNVSSHLPESRRAEDDDSSAAIRSLPPRLISGRQASPRALIRPLEAAAWLNHRKPKSQISQMTLKTHAMFDISVAAVVSVISSSCTVWMRADANRLERDALMCAWGMRSGISSWVFFLLELLASWTCYLLRLIWSATSIRRRSK